MTIKYLLGVLIFLILVKNVAFSQEIPISDQKAIQGVLDLRQYQNYEDIRLPLDGEWQFYWKKLDINGSPDGIYPIPGEWTGRTLNNEVLGSYGHGIITLKVLLNSQSSWVVNRESLGLYVHGASTAYDFQVFDKNMQPLTKLHRSGIFGNQETTVPLYRRLFVSFEAHEEFTIVWRISNYHRKLGGVWFGPIFSSEHKMMNDKTIEEFIDLFSLGILFVIGIYHLILFALRTKERSPLWFGLYSLALAIRGFMANHYLEFLFPDRLYWHEYTRIEFSAYYVSVPLAVAFLSSVFDKVGHRYLVRLMLGFGILSTFTSIFLPAQLYLPLLPAVQGLTLLVVIWWMVVLVASLFTERRQFALILFVGSTIFAITVVNDVLFGMRVIATLNLTQYGLSVIIISQAVVLAVINQKARYMAENLSVELSNSNSQLKKQSDELIRMNEIKDSFLANTSHELRTPLNGIIGIAESLVDGACGKLNQIAVENIQLISQSGHRLSRMVNDLLDFSKMKNQDLEVEIKSVDITTIIKSVVMFTHTLAEQKKIFLTYQHTSSFWVVGDEQRLEQVIINLVGNAIKFTSSGGVTVSVASDDLYVTVSITDTGIGVAKDKHRLIFEEFQQGDGSITRNYGGTGLGLSISKRLVELMDGQIGVSSELGKGSCFYFKLFKGDPSQAVATNSLNTSSAKEMSRNSILKLVAGDDEVPVVSSTGSSLRVLVADDEMINRQVLKNHLSNHGYLVDLVENGEEAVLQVLAVKPDLVLMDLMMPVKNGYDACADIRKTYSTTELPIIMLTAKNQAEDVVKGFSVGANDYLTKPFQKEEMLIRVKTHIEFRNSIDSLRNAERIKKEIQTAQLVQEFLIPKETPQIQRGQLGSYYKFASETGGDWYDFRIHNEGQQVDVLLGDVTGHGAPAAMITAMVNSFYATIKEHLKQAYQCEVGKLRKPVYLLEMLNNLLYATTKGEYTLSFFYSVYNSEDRTLTFTSAGHPPALWWHPHLAEGLSRADRVKKGISSVYIPLSPLLGDKYNIDYKMETIQLSVGDVVVWYTDGLTENVNSEGKAVGLRPIRAFLAEMSPDLTAQEICDQIVEKTTQFCGDTPADDDVTVIVLKVS